MKKKEKLINSFKCEFLSRSVNESFGRSVASAFIMQSDPTLEQLCDIKTAVSEAVTNCVVHAYADKEGKVILSGEYYGNGMIRFKIKDKGCGIKDVKKAMEPLYTTDTTGERGGMGFAVMEAFTDKLNVKSAPGKGTTVTLVKYIGKEKG